MPDSRNVARPVALAALLALTADCTTSNGAPATTTAATTTVAPPPSATTAPLVTTATAAPPGSASAAPIASTPPQPPSVPGAADALAFLDTSYRACDAYIRTNHFGESIGYPDPTNEAFHFTVLAVGPRPQIPAEGVPMPWRLDVEPALTAKQFLVKTGTNQLMIVDLAKHIITGVQGPKGETVAPSCPSDVFPGTWE